MKNLHDAVSEIQNKNWTFTNNFNVQLLFGENALSQKCGLNGLDINLYIKDCNIPQLGTSTIIEKFILERPRIAMGVWEPTVFQFKFRDFDNLDLYKRFVAYVAGERYAYFDDYKFQVKLIKLGDHSNDQSEKHVLTLDNCYMTTVSQITLSNDNDAQILEFEVQIKSASLESVEGLISSKTKDSFGTKSENSKQEVKKPDVTPARPPSHIPQVQARPPEYIPGYS